MWRRARGPPAHLQHFLVGAVAEEEGGDALAAEGLGERAEAAVAVVERARPLTTAILLHRPQLERQRRRAERLGDERGERGRRRADLPPASAGGRGAAARWRSVLAACASCCASGCLSAPAIAPTAAAAASACARSSGDAGLRAVQVGEEEERRPSASAPQKGGAVCTTTSAAPAPPSCPKRAASR